MVDRWSLQFATASNCVSDRMYMWKHILADYQDTHKGQLPQSLQVGLANSNWGRSKIIDKEHPMLNCDQTSKPYLYLPQDVQLPNGKMIMMCPRNSHGFITKFSFGIAYGEGQWHMVKINADGTTDIRHTM